MNSTINDMAELISEIEQRLNTTEQMLARTGAFDGTVNQSSLDELLDEIMLYNDTIVDLATSAERLLEELMKDQEEASRAWEEIEQLNTSVQVLLANASSAQDDVDRAGRLEDQFSAEHEALRLNLTNLSVKANDLQYQLALLNASASNSSRSTTAAYVSVQELSSDLQELRAQADTVINLTHHLNSSIQGTQTASQQLVESTNTLLVCLNTARIVVFYILLPL